MPTDAASLTREIVACLERQIAWHEQILVELVLLSADLDGDRMEAALDKDMARFNEIGQFHKELVELSAQWNQMDPSTHQQHPEVSRLAELAHQKNAEVCAVYDALVGRIQQRSGVLGSTINKLRRGRSLLVGYRPAIQSGPDIVDKKA